MMSNNLLNYYLVVDSGAEECKLGLLRVNNSNFKDTDVLVSSFRPKSGLAEEIDTEIKDFLASKNLQLKDLNKVICSSGPGSFTGLRTSLAFLQGVCFSLGIQLIYSSSFLASGLIILEEQGGGKINLLLRANKEEFFYTSIKRLDKEVESYFEIEDVIIINDSDPRVLEDAFDIAKLPLRSLIQGFNKCLGLLNQRSLKNNILDYNNNLGEHLKSWQVGDAYIAPMYIKEASALTLSERGVKSPIDLEPTLG